MGGCFTRIRRCGECCCYICCMGGIFYHMYDEGNLTCNIVKETAQLSSEIFVSGVIKNK